MGAWNGWYHVIGNTYGTWLPGDPRGWRSRHHGEHVDGDYKRPPPCGLYDGLHQNAEALKKRGAVILSPRDRQRAGMAMVEMLIHQEGEILSLSMDGVHFHLLGRFGSSPIRDVVGRAKKHAYHVLRASGHVGEVWAKRCDTRPIRNREHQVNTYHYVLDHVQVGAWVWAHNQGVYWESTLDFR